MCWCSSVSHLNRFIVAGMFTLSSFPPLLRACIIWQCGECHGSWLFIPICAILITHNEPKSQSVPTTSSPRWREELPGNGSSWCFWSPLCYQLVGSRFDKARDLNWKLVHREASTGTTTPSAKLAFGWILPSIVSKPTFFLLCFLCQL